MNRERERRGTRQRQPWQDALATLDLSAGMPEQTSRPPRPPGVGDYIGKFGTQSKIIAFNGRRMLVQDKDGSRYVMNRHRLEGPAWK